MSNLVVRGHVGIGHGEAVGVILVRSAGVVVVPGVLWVKSLMVRVLVVVKARGNQDRGAHW